MQTNTTAGDLHRQFAGGPPKSRRPGARLTTALPIWSFIVIVLAVLVIYNLTVHPYEPAPRRPGERQP